MTQRRLTEAEREWLWQQTERGELIERARQMAFRRLGVWLSDEEICARAARLHHSSDELGTRAV